MQKSLPPATFGNLLPPNKDYAYFENADRHPFVPVAERFEPVNAWWLADAALLAYADPEFASARFKHAGLTTVEFFSGRNTDCYIAHNDDFAIVAFRGTEIADYRDFVTDLNIRLTDSDQGGRVHQGFKDALDEVWAKKKLKPYLDELQRGAGRPRTVWFTGHSLGAALATLAAGRFSSAHAVYTFGSPRVGDHAFRPSYSVETYRVVNNNDFVTRLPPDPPYAHVGHLKYIDSAGRLHGDSSRLHRLKDDLEGHLTHLTQIVGRLRSGLAGEILDDTLADHAPVYYATHLWNHYARIMSGR